MADLDLPQRKGAMDWANEIEVQRRAFTIWRRAALSVMPDDRPEKSGPVSSDLDDHIALSVTEPQVFKRRVTPDYTAKTPDH